MLTAIGIIFLAAALAPTLNRLFPSFAHWLLALAPAGGFVWFAGQFATVVGGQPVAESWKWVPALGVELAFRLDGLSLLFALLITGIGTLIVLYSGGYLRGHRHEGRFLFFIMAFMGAMLGLVLADDIISLFVFWELTSVTSFLLIGFNHADARSRRSALQALLVTGGGGMALLAGLILLGTAGGAGSLSEIAAKGMDLTTHGLYLPILALLVLAAFTKSAQVPFHFWLPNAMDAPTPVSAYLHSATMVKAGIYLLARLSPMLGGTDIWFWTLTGFGALTAFWGGAMALRATDLKKILAYTTLMALGTLTMLVGLGTDYAIRGFAAFLLAHSLYKGALFMGAGSVDHGSGTREVGELSGLFRAMPVTGVFIALAALSMSGLPPFLGFIGKELIYEGLLTTDRPVWPVLVASVLANATMLGAAGLVFVKPFLGAPSKAAAHAHEGGVTLWLGPALLASLGLLLGLYPAVLDGLLGQVAASVRGEPLAVELHLWHGLTPALGLSAITVALGIGFYLALRPLTAGLAGLERATRFDADKGWDHILNGLDALARAVTGQLQGGVMTRYMAIIFTAMLLLLGSTLWFRQALVLPATDLGGQWVGLLLGIMMLVGTAGALRARSRLGAITALSINGLSVAMFFIAYGAPDVGITQLMVETLTAIILVLVLARLPALPKGPDRKPQAAFLHGILALGLGGVVTAILLAIIALPLPMTLSQFFGDTSYLEAYGRNVVNVILVDFRGFDTLGEITVVASAGLGVLALLKARYARPKAKPQTGPQTGEAA
ncbi:MULTISPECIES: putative monovalent cation/H+ antiporter subunit A [unclassified Azospirillum]|uniref:putative monovalent cation/H+ antiporter subunit A n=1 Tax=unclassified Azospirillum TaxID=2630922 RepID=UPI000B6B8148|nr:MULTISPECIES: putative monovalent cation/H+ antiporter subunit A [unclassified Azospirillum]SNS80581.1 multisubunit sodium/proton antiporter, MrpA subunit [Azospirillum sp. RU38E]SNS97677.1 multisubunit sodium/proton antiporter, MrpA subunit [Azospirillum sp. RU37A]